jgi:hypothetical protein
VHGTNEVITCRRTAAVAHAVDSSTVKSTVEPGLQGLAIVMVTLLALAIVLAFAVAFA